MNNGTSRRILSAKDVDSFKLQPIKMDTKKIDMLKDALDIQVKPANDRDLDDHYNSSSIELEWEVVSFEGDTLIIQIRFKHVNELSPETEQDQIVIKLKPDKSEALNAPELNQRLDSDFHQLVWKIPKQLPPDGPDKGLATTTYIFGWLLRLLLVGTIIMSFWLPGTVF